MTMRDLDHAIALKIDAARDIYRAIDANVQAMYTDSISEADFREANFQLWKKADLAGLLDDVRDMYREEHKPRRVVVVASSVPEDEDDTVKTDCCSREVPASLVAWEHEDGGSLAYCANGCK